MNSEHPSPFSTIPADQPVGPLGGRRQMETFDSVTLMGMMQGKAGEPEHVVSLARSILAERKRALQNAGGAL